MSTKSKIWAALASAYTVSVAWSIYVGEYSLTLLSTAAFFAIGSGILFSQGSEGNSNKRRDLAMTISVVPGMAHIYLHENKRAASFLLSYSASFIVLLLFISFPEDSALCLSVMIAVISILIFTSKVDTEYICNKLQIPYSGSPTEFRIKSYKTAYAACILIPSLIPIITAIYVLSNGVPEEDNVFLYPAIAAVFIVMSAISVVQSGKVENNGYSK